LEIQILASNQQKHVAGVNRFLKFTCDVNVLSKLSKQYGLLLWKTIWTTVMENNMDYCYEKGV
jgi:hypothetical protein